MTSTAKVAPPAAVALVGRVGLDIRAEPPIPAMSASPRAFHASMTGYRPTPLRDAPGAGERLGVAEVLVKDESEWLGLPSFKVLGASWAVHRALVEHLGSTLEEIPTFEALRQRARPPARSPSPPRRMATTAGRWPGWRRCSGSGPHLRAGRHGAGAHRGIEAEGATVTVLDGTTTTPWRARRGTRARRLVISDTSWPGYERVPRCDRGLRHDLRRDRQALNAGSRTSSWSDRRRRAGDRGGTPSVLDADRPRMVGCRAEWRPVCWRRWRPGERQPGSPDVDHGRAELRHPLAVAWPLVSRGIDVYLAVPDGCIGEATRLLAQVGIGAGESGAAGLAAMTAVSADAHLGQAREALGLGGDSRVLLLCTEGATDPDGYRRLIGAEDSRDRRHVDIGSLGDDGGAAPPWHDHDLRQSGVDSASGCWSTSPATSVT